MWHASPTVSSGHPILYWVTDANPAREDQVDLFHRWQVDHGYATTLTLNSQADARTFLAAQGRLFRKSLLTINPELAATDKDDDQAVRYPATIRLPLAELRLDTANADLAKRFIQGVSGVGGDVMDGASRGTMWQLHGIGLLRDLTEDARRLGFSPEKT